MSEPSYADVVAAAAAGNTDPDDLTAMAERALAQPQLGDTLSKEFRFALAHATPAQLQEIDGVLERAIDALLAGETYLF